NQASSLYLPTGALRFHSPYLYEEATVSELLNGSGKLRINTMALTGMLTIGANLQADLAAFYYFLDFSQPINELFNDATKMHYFNIILNRLCLSYAVEAIKSYLGR